MTVMDRLHRIPAAAYVFLAVSVVGAIVEVSYHFVPPTAIPALYQWINSLSAADKDFYGLVYELIAHVFVAAGLLGMVTVFVYRQLKNTDL